MKPETIIDAKGNEVTLIHFVTGDPPRIACMPNLANMSASGGVNQQRLTPHMRSGEASDDAVTCPMCKRTDLFTNAKKQAKKMPTIDAQHLKTAAMRNP